MTAEDFRRLALSLPETSENAHMGHPDFRVRGKVFATLGPNDAWGMVKLTPEQQAALLRTEAEVFTTASGAWGRRGCTMVRLCDAHESTVLQVMIAAWGNTAPKRLGQQFNEDQGGE